MDGSRTPLACPKNCRQSKANLSPEDAAKAGDSNLGGEHSLISRGSGASGLVYVQFSPVTGGRTPACFSAASPFVPGYVRRLKPSGNIPRLSEPFRQDR